MSRAADPTAKISLLRAAEQVFAEHGLAAAKVEEIAHRAGVSKGAFYLHFVSKEEALKQVVESFLARLGAMLPPPDAVTTPDTAEGMLDYWLEQDLQMFEFLWQNRTIVAILFGCQGQYLYLLEAFKSGIQKTSRDWIELSMRRGFLRRDLDPALVATVLCGGYQELWLKMMTHPKKPPVADWLRQTLSMFMRGIGGEGVARAAEALVAPADSPVSARGRV